MREINFLQVERAIAIAWSAYLQYEKRLGPNSSRKDEWRNTYIDTRDHAIRLAEIYGIERLIKLARILPLELRR